MKKLLPALIIALFCIMECVNSFAAGKTSYDAFYSSDPDFKKMDAELNDIYKTAINDLSGQDKLVFINEQRTWHNKLFPILVEHQLPRQTPAAAALEVLRERIDNLEKFVNSRSASGIMGLPIKFGMSRQEVAKILDIGDKVNASESNDISPFTIKLFGSDVPVFFKFSTTNFKCQEQTAAKRFQDFLADVMKLNSEAGVTESPEQLKNNGYAITSLWSVQTGDMYNEKDCAAVLDGLEKKYKIVYPVYFPILSIINDKVADYSDLYDTAFKKQVFQDKSRYIFVDQSWGTLTGVFNIDYISQTYLNRHIEDIDAITFVLLETSRFKNSLGILAENADINDIINTIGNRDVVFSANYPEYYELFAEIKGKNDKSVNVNLYLDKNNTAFAIQYQYIEDDMQPGFEGNLIKKLDRNYKVLKETPQNILGFVGHVTNFDRDWETEDNYIHLGSTPHFAVQHELLVIKKNKIDAYNAITSRFDEQQSAAHEEEVRKELEKF